ncbi:hypothetical protein IAT38_006955 [Cryptococcus sp. DSM 104549]
MIIQHTRLPARVPTRLCARAPLSGHSTTIHAKLYSTAPAAEEHDPEQFDDIAEELKRRRRKADAKRRQYGTSFIDHAIVTVRGGKGGNGAAALAASLRGPSAPAGGNGAQGGSVYLTTSSDLTSLATVRKRLIGAQGGSGSGAFRHGRRGEDLLVEVPVGTIIREIRREGEEERTLREEEEMGLDEEEKRRKRWQRWFIAHPSAGGELSEEEYVEGEAMLKRERRWTQHTPSFAEVPPLELDITRPLSEPVLLAAGGQGGLGNPFFSSTRLASRGSLPPTLTFEFELKLLADVGLVGFPNAGKSTLLRALTGRKAEVAGYQFTTLNPQIGVVRVYEDGTWAGQGGEVVEETWVEREREAAARLTGEQAFAPAPTPSLSPGGAPRLERTRFTLSDNPGLLPSASANVGLGHAFLRGIERSPVLAYVLDLTRPSPAEDLASLRAELEAYKPGLAGRAGVVILNKGDGVDEATGRARVSAVEKAVEALGDDGEVIVLSGKYGLGMERLVSTLAERVEVARQEREAEKEAIRAEEERFGVTPRELGERRRDGGKVVGPGTGGTGFGLKEERE